MWCAERADHLCDGSTHRLQEALIVRSRYLPSVRAAGAGLAALAVLTAGCSDDSGTPSKKRSHSVSPSGEHGPNADASAAPAKGSVKVVRTVTTGSEVALGAGPAAGRRSAGLLPRQRHDQPGRRGERQEDRARRGAGRGAGGEGGLLGLAVSPTFASDHMVYAYFTTESDNRIARMLYDEEKPAGRATGRSGHDLQGHPQGRDPQRRPDRLRPGQDALRGHGRDR